MVGNLVKSMKEDHYVSDNGDIVYYQTDPKLSNFPAKKEEWLYTTQILKENYYYF